MTLTVFSESSTPLPRRKATAPARLPPPAPPNRPSGTPSAPASSTALSAITGNTGVSAVSSVSPLVSAEAARGRTRMMPTASGVASATVHKQSRPGVTLLSISGRLTEAFKGEATGRDLRGTVAIDLGGAERITSFGVREWLSMLAAMHEVRRLYLLRCSEATVNQLSMIRKFCGSGRVVSFFAPYLCTACGEPFERSFDCELEADAIRAGRAPEAQCPHCGSSGTFDDDARSYFAFAAPHLNTAVPPEVRAILQELEAAAPAAPREAIDKSVEGNVTRVRVSGRLDGAVRWTRVLDGIEGALVLDLGGVTADEPAGLVNLGEALGAFGPEVVAVALERCPAAVVGQLAQAALPPRVSVTSGTLDAFCTSCAVQRPALVSIIEHGDVPPTRPRHPETTTRPRSSPRRWEPSRAPTAWPWSEGSKATSSS